MIEFTFLTLLIFFIINTVVAIYSDVMSDDEKMAAGIVCDATTEFKNETANFLVINKAANQNHLLVDSESMDESLFDSMFNFTVGESNITDL